MHDDHSHVHECHCGHDHYHAHEPGKHTDEETPALLTYTLDHNRHHGEELHEIYHALEAAGKKDAATALHEAMHLYSDANDKLAQALELMK